MRPSQVRQLILEDHVALRGLLADVTRLLERSQAGERGLVPELRLRGQQLHDRFLQHLALEDAHLVPALREVDAWGEERAARVTREHGEQRARMAALLERIDDAELPGDALAAELDALTRDLHADMEHEEAAVLREDLLRDDVVGVDVETG